MCGIAGAINLEGSRSKDILRSLIHRGPDEQSSLFYKSVFFVHTRLAIQDISDGHQPFEYQNFAIIYNGEIYNHLELRKHYLKECKFRTNSDTETLLRLYIKYKVRMFDYIDGMYAFAILDKKNNKIIFGRDRAGKKPLYIYQGNNKVLFASELNTIKIGIDNLEINQEGIQAYLRCGFFFKESTPYQNIKELEAGSIYYLNIDTLELKKTRYFDILKYYNNPNTFNPTQAKEVLDDALHKSVKDRLMSSDLEVGAFLSGGIDSSLIVAIASQYQKLKTFTVKLSGGYDESSLAQLTAKKYNTEHYELNISMNLKNDVEKILVQYGEPYMDSSAIPSYYVSQEAKKYVTVILNGDGADELFAGYRRYIPVANNMLVFAKKFKFLLSILPKQKNKLSLYNYLYRLLLISDKSNLSFYLSATNDIFEDQYKFEKNSIILELENFINKVQMLNISPLSKFLYLDFNLILFSDLLPKMDIATMAHSLEGRSPFLSKYFLELVPTLNDKYKIKGMTTKSILRELSKSYLPEKIIRQPKRGFEVPLKNWVENELKDSIYDALTSNCYSKNFIKMNFINYLLEGKVNASREKRAKMLWSLYCLEIWFKNLSFKM